MLQLGAGAVELPDHGQQIRDLNVDTDSIPAGLRLHRHEKQALAVEFSGSGVVSRENGDEDIVIAGLAELLTYTTALFDFWLARVDAETGELQWSLIEGSQYADDYSISMSADIDGSFLVAGLGSGFPILKFDETGMVAWIRAVAPDPGIYSGFAVLELEDGSYMIPGFKYLQRPGDAFDAVLLRYSEPNAP